jgi:hypothetical protein
VTEVDHLGHPPGGDEAPRADQGGTDDTSQRQTFLRRCVYLGVTLAVLGAAGLARFALLGLGALVLVLALLTHLIGLEPIPEEPSAGGIPEDDLDDEPEGEPAQDDEPEGEPALDEPPEDDATLVRFWLPTAVDATTVALVGEFNDWSSDANPMERRGDRFETSLRLATGRTYRYRFLLDGHRWENAWDAAAYLPNEHGTDDSVVDLTSPAPPPAGP